MSGSERISPNVRIKSDATATIIMAGLIGTNYIGVDHICELWEMLRAAMDGPVARSSACPRTSARASS